MGVEVSVGVGVPVSVGVGVEVIVGVGVSVGVGVPVGVLLGSKVAVGVTKKRGSASILGKALEPPISAQSAVAAPSTTADSIRPELANPDLLSVTPRFYHTIGSVVNPLAIVVNSVV